MTLNCQINRKNKRTNLAPPPPSQASDYSHRYSNQSNMMLTQKEIHRSMWNRIESLQIALKVT